MEQPADVAPTFHRQSLRDASFRECSLNDARFVECDLRGVSFRGVWFTDVEVDGLVERLVVNGVDVTGYVEAELDRRHPGRSTVKAVCRDDAAGLTADAVREAWRVAVAGWPATVERARRLPAGAVHERVDGEWSFVETLRHMVFVIDAWLRRPLLGDPSPYHPLDLHHSEMEQVDGVPHDPDARPDVEEVWGLLQQRFDEVEACFAGFTDESIAGEVTTPDVPGYPENGTYAVMRCVGAVVDETWEHRLIAERDLATLER